MPAIPFQTFCLATATLMAAASFALAAPAATPSSNAGATADKAWEEIVRNSRVPEPPESWRDSRPSQEEFDKFKKSEAERLAKAAASAQDFQTRFPNDSRLDQAQLKEYELLAMAAQLGNTNVVPRLDALDEAKLKNPKISDEERFHIRARALNRRAMSKLNQGQEAALTELELGARALMKDFPNRSEPYEMLQAVALEAEPTKAVKIAKELSESAAAPEQVKEAVKPLLRLGKPLSVKFTAVDGRRVDLEKLRGKVVLIDFWATWCGPCVGEVPNVVAAYENLHPKGFEIVGISFDESKDKLAGFVKEQKMTWPQYFDGKKWENDFGRQFDIQSIPAMWLVDKKGNLRDLNGRDDLAGKVEQLLAEK